MVVKKALRLSRDEKSKVSRGGKISWEIILGKTKTKSFAAGLEVNSR